MTHDQNLDSNFWVMLVRLIEKSCETSAVWCDFRHVDIGMTAQESFRGSTIWYFNASGSEDLATLPGIHDRHNSVVPDESSSKQDLGQNLIALSGDSYVTYVGLSLFASAPLLSSLQLHGFHL